MNISLVGYGKMGKSLCDLITEDKIVCIVSKERHEDLEATKNLPDVIIDFSHPSNLEMIYKYACKNKIPVVIATTGFTVEAEEKIHKLAKQVPVLYSANFSLGITVLNKIIKEITPALKKEFDIEILEHHHADKLDVPSGTAKMLVQSLNEQLNYKVVYGRSSSGKRKKGEIGVHSLRSGGVVGHHEVIYAAMNEILSINHEVLGREVFAKGALLAARWVVKQKCGLYSMEDVLFNERTD